MKKSAALLLGIFIISIIMAMTLAIGYNTLKTLIIGTNITDYELAHQGAEAGLENALAGLGSFPSSQLVANWDGSSTVTRRLMLNNPEPYNNDPYYIRRDMSAFPGGGLDRVNISNVTTSPADQYWFYKVWKQETNIVPAFSYWRDASFWPQNSATGTLLNAVKSDRAPACLNAALPDDPYPPPPPCDNTRNFSKQDGYYSFLTNIRGTHAGADPASINLHFWAWSDNCQGVSIDLVDHKPRILNAACSAPTSQVVPGEITQSKSWALFEAGFNITSTPLTGEINGNYFNYTHVYYYIEPSAAVIGAWSTQNRVSGGIGGYKPESEYYNIDAVGMYGSEKVHLRAILDPGAKSFWRINLY